MTSTESNITEDRLSSAKLTPMMRQYLSVKQEHPEAIVLFRMGDFFETFYEDAEACARLLDLTLTARSKEKDPIPMAGVPHHAVENYVSRLIDLGKTVVLVDQVEDPKLAKGLVRREVTDVLSPGTYLDPHAPPRVPTYLVALFLAEARRGKAGWGLAALDVSTGEFRATSGEDEELLIDELGRLAMREIVVAETQRESAVMGRVRGELPKAAITFARDEDFERKPAERALVRTLGADESRAVQGILSESAVCAAGAAIAYVERMQPRKTDDVSLRHVRELKPYVPGDSLVLDAQARAHLELFRASGDGGKKGSLIGAIDDAITAMGGRLLARWLAYPLRNLSAISERQDAIATLVAAPSALDRIREELRGVADLERLVGRVVMGRATPRDLGALIATLDRAPKLLGDAGSIADRRARGDGGDLVAMLEIDRSVEIARGILANIARTPACEEIAAKIREALVDDPPSDVDSGDVFREGWNPELDRLSDLSRNGKAAIAKMEAEERERTGISSLKIRYNRVFGYYLEVTKSNLKSVPATYIRKQTTANGERYYTEELRALESDVLSAEEKRVELVRRLFGELVAAVAAEARALTRLAGALAELDVLGSLANLAEKRGWVRPIVDQSGAIEIADGRHPVIELYSSELGERFVPNDLTITGERSLMIITGPNMAGKSTIMRQTALIVILAHMGSYCPVRSARVGLVDRIFTRVGASDDLSRGRSTFMVEMNETARILRSATRDSLILLDEIGRGTSTFDGLSIAWAVAEYLAQVVGAKTLFATHYHELTDICREQPRAVNHHVAVKEWNEQIVFLRKLMPGPTNRSYGVQVARLAGLPKTVVERARQVLASLESQALSAGDRSLVSRKIESGPESGQLFLFAKLAPKPVEEESDPVVREVIEAVEATAIDDLTPRQALELLAELKDKLSQRKKR